MTKRHVSSLGVGRHDSNSSRREQALCRAALVSEEFDELTDQEWVAMCERIARESERANNGALDDEDESSPVDHAEAASEA
jgi:hypothetical protein